MSEGLDGALPQGSGLAAALPQGVWACWCAAAGGLGLLVRCLGFRWGWSPKRPRPGGLAGGGSGSRAVASVGRKDLRSCAGTPRLLRLLRDPVTNAEAFDRGRTKEESWVPLGVGWAALLPSRGPCPGKVEALPTSDPLAVDLPPLERSEGGRSTDGTRKRRILAPTASHSPRTGAAAPPSRPVEALSERRTSRSRADAAPPRVEAAPTQPHPESQSRPHSRRSSPTRNDAAAGQASRADDVRRPGPAAARPGGGRSPCAGRR